MSNKRTKKKQSKLKKIVAKKRKPVKKTVAKKTPKKKTVPKKNVAAKAVTAKTATANKTTGKIKTKPVAKVPAAKTARTAGKRAPRRDQRLDAEALASQGSRSESAGQAGDLQGLSRRESADSESVDELLEEGNAFEADAVLGVEDAGNGEGQEVHTHEVSEDDVPEEYLDKD